MGRRVAADARDRDVDIPPWGDGSRRRAATVALSRALRGFLDRRGRRGDGRVLRTPVAPPAAATSRRRLVWASPVTATPRPDGYRFMSRRRRVRTATVSCHGDAAAGRRQPRAQVGVDFTNAGGARRRLCPGVAGVTAAGACTERLGWLQVSHTPWKMEKHAHHPGGTQGGVAATPRRRHGRFAGRGDFVSLSDRIAATPRRRRGRFAGPRALSRFCLPHGRIHVVAAASTRPGPLR